MSLVSPEHRLIRRVSCRFSHQGSNHGGRQAYNCLNLINIFNRVQQNNRDPKRFRGCRLKKIALFPKGGPKPDLDPRPPDLHQNVHNIIANTPGKLMAPEGSFGNPLSDRDFHPAHLGTSRHKLSVQRCLDISS